MKKQNKIKKELVQMYVAAVVNQRLAYKKYHDYKAKLDGKAVVIVGEDLILADRTRECAVMDGKVEGLKNALRELYSKYEIKLFTDAATLLYINSYEDGDFDGALGCVYADDDDEDDDTPDCDDDDGDDGEDNQCAGWIEHTDDAVIQAMKGNESN